jgi:hypothetical protein
LGAVTVGPVGPLELVVIVALVASGGPTMIDGPDGLVEFGELVDLTGLVELVVLVGADSGVLPHPATSSATTATIAATSLAVRIKGLLRARN